MKLWLLRPREGIPKEGNPWVPWYDKAFGFVVRADTETAARIIASDNSWNNERAWMTPDFSTCEELLATGEAGMVMKDFRAS